MAASRRIALGTLSAALSRTALFVVRRQLRFQTATNARLQSTLVWKKAPEKAPTKFWAHAAVARNEATGSHILVFDRKGVYYSLDTQTMLWGPKVALKRPPGLRNLFRLRTIGVNHNSAYLKDNAVYTIGKGLVRSKSNILYRADLTTNEAAKVSPIKFVAQNYAGAVIGNRLFLVGDTYHAQNIDGPIHTAYFDLTTNKWDDFPKVSGVPPKMRINPLAAAIGSRLFTFTPNSTLTSFEVHYLDTTTMAWTKPPVSGPEPEPLSLSAITTLGNRVVIFGGVLGGGLLRGYTNTVLVFNTDTFVWETPIIEGPPPSPRGSHTATAINDRRIVVVGGRTEFGVSPPDVYTLDLVA